MSEEKAGQPKIPGDEPKSAEVQSFSVRPARRLPHFSLPAPLKRRKVYLPLIIILILLIGAIVWWITSHNQASPKKPVPAKVSVLSYTKEQIEAKKQQKVVQGVVKSLTTKQIMVEAAGKEYTLSLTKDTAYYHLDTYKDGQASDVRVGQHVNVEYNAKTNQAESVWYKA